MSNIIKLLNISQTTNHFKYNKLNFFRDSAFFFAYPLIPSYVPPGVRVPLVKKRCPNRSLRYIINIT